VEVVLARGHGFINTYRDLIHTLVGRSPRAEVT
jgi:hypothetical protein